MGVKDVDLVVPMIHHNGSSRERLIEDLCEASNALRKAIELVANTAPHMRDYYLFKDAQDRFDRARREHFDRMTRLHSVLEELIALANLIDEAPGPRR